MRLNIWAPLSIVPSIAVFCIGAASAASDTHLTPKKINLQPMNIEVAGADTSDRATNKQLKDAGAEMIPSESLKQAKPGQSKPSSKQTKAVPVKAEPKSQPMEKAIPLTETPTKMANDMTGPYLRLDIGMALNSDTDGTQSAGALSSGSIDNTAIWGGGIGYQFSKNFRADASISYHPDASVNATTSASNTTSTDVNALSGMVNGYWDIATFGGMTPYVGAGVGFAHLSTSDQTTTGGIATESGSTTNNLAWSLNAGAAYDIFQNTALDMNYRFINMGEFKQSVSTTYDELSAHEVRAGLRFKF